LSYSTSYVGAYADYLFTFVISGRNMPANSIIEINFPGASDWLFSEVFLK
jgi:hypothetical protein